MSKIVVDRAVLEQALAITTHWLELDKRNHCDLLTVSEYKLITGAVENLRAALEKPACKLVGWWHDVEELDECDFFYADAINGDCPSCHPCYADIGGEK